MKKLFSILTVALFMSSSWNADSSSLQNQRDLPNDDCGGCIAWADSRDDGSDRTLRNWNRDLANCRANSPDCQPELAPA